MHDWEIDTILRRLYAERDKLSRRIHNLEALKTHQETHGPTTQLPDRAPA